MPAKGLEHNFNLVRKRFGATAHVRAFDTVKYPWQDLINLFVKMDYKGWILLDRTPEHSRSSVHRSPFHLFT